MQTQSTRNKDINTEKYSTDASIFKIKPNNVHTAEDIFELQDFVMKSKHITARAAGTCMSGGSLTEFDMVDITNLNKILEINSEDKNNGYAYVESGILYRDLESALKKDDMFFAPYTSSKNICSLGGMLGNNASGEKSLTYGATVKNILEVEMLMHTGEIIIFKEISEQEVLQKIENKDNTISKLESNIYKNIFHIYNQNKELIKFKRPHSTKVAAGYNIFDIYNENKKTWSLIPIIIGSQSTLGIITKVKIKTYPILPYSYMAVIATDHIHDLPKIVKTCVDHKSTSVECYDDNTYKLAIVHMKKDADLANISKNKKITIIAEFCGNDEEEIKSKVKNLIEDIQKNNPSLVNSTHEVNNDDERNAYWNIRRASFALLRDFSPSTHRAIPIIEDTIVSIDLYDQFLNELLEILYKYDMTYTYAGHIGEGSIRLIPLIKKDTLNANEIIFKMAEEVYKLVAKYKGSISTDHNDGLARSYYLKEFYGDEFYKIIKSIKETFDPENKFNPGKKVNGDREFAKSKISL